MNNFVSFLTALPTSSLAGTLIYPQIINALIYYKAHIWLSISSIQFLNNTPLLKEWAQSVLHDSSTGSAFLSSLTSCSHSLALMFCQTELLLWAILSLTRYVPPFIQCGQYLLLWEAFLDRWSCHADYVRCTLQSFRITPYLLTLILLIMLS